MRCQFCNHHFIIGGHYGRHLRAYHPGKQLGSNSLQTAATPEQPQGVSRTIKRRRLSELRAANTLSSQPIVALEDNDEVLVSIETPDRRGTAPDPVSQDASLEQRLPQRLMVGQVIHRSLFSHIRDPSWNPLSPFTNAYEYKLARFFHQSKTSMKQIGRFFHDQLIPVDTFRTLEVGYKSGHTWRKKMRGLVDQPQWHNGTMDFHLQTGVKFFYRDVVESIGYLLRQKAFAEDLVFEPIREFDRQGCRVYTEMHTADWWWEMQVCFRDDGDSQISSCQTLTNHQMTLPVGSSLIPVLITSDQTCLTNFSGDKKLWPMFMSLGNIPSGIRNKPSNQAWILLALLPIGPKRTKSLRGFSVQNQEYDSLETQHRLIERILAPLVNIFEVTILPEDSQGLWLTHNRPADLKWCVAMRTSGDVSLFYQHGLQITWRMSIFIVSK